MPTIRMTGSACPLIARSAGGVPVKELSLGGWEWKFRGSRSCPEGGGEGVNVHAASSLFCPASSPFPLCSVPVVGHKVRLPVDLDPTRRCAPSLRDGGVSLRGWEFDVRP